MEGGSGWNPWSPNWTVNEGRVQPGSQCTGREETLRYQRSACVYFMMKLLPSKSASDRGGSPGSPGCSGGRGAPGRRLLLLPKRPALPRRGACCQISLSTGHQCPAGVAAVGSVFQPSLIRKCKRALTTLPISGVGPPEPNYGGRALVFSTESICVWGQRRGEPFSFVLPTNRGGSKPVEIN